MRAIRVHESGGIDAMRLDEIPRPVPGAGEVLVAVKAAGVGPWDRLVREGQSGLRQAPPLTLGSDISGTVAALGADVDVFALGDAIYGATNDQFWSISRRCRSFDRRRRALYSEIGAFNHAFKRWTGTSPGRSRNRPALAASAC